MKVKHLTRTCFVDIPYEKDIDIITYQARVSNQANKLNFSTGEKLIRSMIKRSEWSPFEMINYGFEIVTTRDVAAQLIRHWTIRPQEFSQRYSEVMNVAPIKLTMQDAKSKHITHPLPPELNDIQEEYSKMIESILALYKKAVGLGVSKETARKILPMNTESILVMNGSLKSWITFLNVRLKRETQEDHRLIAVEIAKCLKDVVPEVYDALNAFGNMTGGFLDPA